MSLPTLTPTSTTSAIILPSTGSTDSVSSALPIGVYSNSAQFITGAAAQVAFTFKRLGGDVLDIELTEENVYANYEDAVLEYSYIVNRHQSKNALGSALGSPTASFDHKGEVTEGTGSALKYPEWVTSLQLRLELAEQKGSIVLLLILLQPSRTMIYRTLSVLPL
jgi:hypothetical protein